MKYPHLFWFCVVALFLGGPLALRTLAPALEAYPVVLMPSGAGLVNLTNATVEFDELAILGLDAQGNKSRLDPIEFIAPIPVHMLPFIVRNDFGLVPGAKKKIRLRKGLAEFEYNPGKVSPEDIQETKAWLSDRLEALGCQRDFLIVERNRVIVDKSTGERTVETISAKTFNLR